MVTVERPTTRERTLADAYRERFGPSCQFNGHVAGDGGDALRAHLRGDASLALSLRDGDGRATTGLIQHRGYRMVYNEQGAARRIPEDGISVLQAARQRLALQGIDAAVERAPGDGARLWVFAAEPVPVEDLHALLHLATRGQEVEISPRPEHDEVEQRAVRAPLGAHPDDGLRYGFVDREGRPVGNTLAAQVAHLDGIRAVDVRRELERRPHLRQELAALDPRGPEAQVAQERRAERMATERQGEQPRRGDRTTRAVQAQLAGMGAERYDVGVYDRAADKMLLRREWRREDVEHAVPWLKRMNAQGREIYIRPSGSSGLYLIDDIPMATVTKMRAEGYTPAVAVETSPGNFQAWMRVSETPLPEAVGTAVAREMAVRYGGDRSSANWRHMGRLAGFTNRKPERTQPDGRPPFVALRDASGMRASDAPAILARAKGMTMREHRLEPSADWDRRVPTEIANAMRSESSQLSITFLSPLGREYRHRAARLLERYPNTALKDLHRLDWMVTRDLARAHPTATKDDLMRAIREGSPRIDERKRGHVDDYAERTTRYVLMDPDVQRVRDGHARGADRDVDRWY